MSESHSNTTHLVRAEVDRVSSGRIVAVGIASLVIFFLASLTAIRMMARDRAALLPDGPAPAAEVGQVKIGIVEQQLFERTRTGPEWKAEQLRRLDGSGWVDRQKGLAHIPVDRAMDLVVQGERP